MLVGKTVLIVDDSVTIRKFLRGLLAPLEIQSSAEAGTGRDAVDFLRANSDCDLVLLDLMLPDLDGMQVLREIREFNESAAIVMITGTGGIRTATMAVSNGADGYIDKQSLTESGGQEFALTLGQALSHRAALVAQRELQTLKSDFYAMVTHDLRSPAGTIGLAMDLLLKGDVGPISGEQAELLAIANHAARKLLVLVNNYLDFAKIDAGHLRLKIETVELSALISASAQLARIQSQAKGQSLTLLLGELPVMIHADGERLQQVVDNLLSNAVKYTPAGGRIEVALLVSGPAVELRITDSGRGFAPEQLPLLFTKYHRLPDAGGSGTDGTGLGLLIVKDIVTAHGGTIKAQSPGPELGSSFTVTLPLPDDSPLRILDPRL